MRFGGAQLSKISSGGRTIGLRCELRSQRRGTIDGDPYRRARVSLSWAHLHFTRAAFLAAALFLNANVGRGVALGA